MKYSIFTLLAATQMQQAHSHYVFNRLRIASTTSTEFQHIRDVTGNSGTYDSLWLKTFPIYGPHDSNQTCGRGSFPVHNSATIETAVIPAGESGAFVVSGPWFDGDTQGYIFHPGPGQVFMSKLPDDVVSLNDYDGSGTYFKIAYAGPANKTSWSTFESLEVPFTIPAATPSGKYLLRVEHFFPSSNRHESQWFVNCAHVEIVGGGLATVEEGDLVRFPNDKYDEDGQSIWFHDEDELGRFPVDLSKYPEPMPTVWKG